MILLNFRYYKNEIFEHIFHGFSIASWDNHPKNIIYVYFINKNLSIQNRKVGRWTKNVTVMRLDSRGTKA